MDREGPPLERLLHRIAETPTDFLAEPRIGRAGRVAVAAVAGDLCRVLGGQVSSAELGSLLPTGDSDHNWLATALILCWLLGDDWFIANAPDAREVLALLVLGGKELAQQTPSRKFVGDPERREELARFALARLGLRPAGESKAQAEDRLNGLSAAERNRVLAAARAAEERARAIREALAKKAAEESADKWTRE